MSKEDILKLYKNHYFIGSNERYFIEIQELYKLENPVEKTRNYHYIGVARKIELERPWIKLKDQIIETTKFYATKEGECWRFLDEAYLSYATDALRELLKSHTELDDFNKMIESCERVI